MSKYVRISCEAYDHLEIAAMKGHRRKMVYWDDGVELECEAVIKDLEARNGAEYAILDSGQVVRLDKIVSWDGNKIAHGGGCKT